MDAIEQKAVAHVATIEGERGPMRVLARACRRVDDGGVGLEIECVFMLDDGSYGNSEAVTVRYSSWQGLIEGIKAAWGGGPWDFTLADDAEALEDQEQVRAELSVFAKEHESWTPPS